MQLSRSLVLDRIGQPTSLPEEVQYRVQDGVDTYEGSNKTRRGEVLTITSHRFYLVDAAKASPVQWNLSQVLNIATEEGGLFVGSPKIVLTLRPLPQAKPAATSSSSAAPAAAPEPIPSAMIKLSFKNGGRDQCLESIRKAVERRSWDALADDGAGGRPPAEKRPRLEAPAPASVMATPGIAGIIKRQELEQKADVSLAQEAFADLNELEKHAKAIVALAESYAGEINRKKAAAAAGSSSSSSSGDGGAGADDGDVNKELGALVTTLGIVNPVTRGAVANANLFNIEVAKQLAGFIRPILEKSGGMLSLTDAYCLYNRARATDLISPEDLLQAAEQGMGRDPKKCPLGVYLREFPSGLKVLQHSDYSDAETGRRIVLLLDSLSSKAAAAAAAGGGSKSLANEPFVSALTLSSKWKVPLQVATQQLLLAEASGALCRDDGLNGLRFYRNRF